MLPSGDVFDKVPAGMGYDSRQQRAMILICLLIFLAIGWRVWWAAR
jgi:hypothetical protein